MLKYLDYATVFAEVPDEITLALEVTNCPFKCKNCHSPELRENIGVELTEDELRKILNKTHVISCICFMVGDANKEDVERLSDFVRNKLRLKAAMYSGSPDYDPDLAAHLDYYKVGPYLEEFGPLNNPHTNQKMYRLVGGVPEDITYRFWPRKVGA